MTNPTTSPQPQTSMSNETWLVYNSTKSIKINRERVANSCWYFRRLLSGPNKESKQSIIYMNFGNMFSYKAFDCVIRYADESIFIRDPELIDLHIEAVQLGILWVYDEFVEVVEAHLIEQISLDTLTDLHGLAKRHSLVLGRLEEACKQYEEISISLDMPRNWSRCHIDGHSNHHYINCRPLVGDLCEDDWDKTVPTELTEEESIELARLRDNLKSTQISAIKRDMPSKLASK